MSAYQLADELRDMVVGEEYDWLIHEIYKLLRQQADRIAELEKESANLEQSLKNALIFIDNRKQTKSLSDEEIAKEWSKFYPDVFHTHLIDFVRAIEERHGIK